MQSSEAKRPLDRFLTLFTEVRSGEGTTAVLLTFNVFLVLTSYYIAKVVREPLILAGGSAELKSYLSAGQILLPMPGWQANTRESLSSTSSTSSSRLAWLFSI
jgi:ATP/ADP translocase